MSTLEEIMEQSLRPLHRRKERAVAQAPTAVSTIAQAAISDDGSISWEAIIGEQTGYQLRKGKGLTATDARGEKVELPPDAIIEGTWRGKVTKGNVRKNKDGDWEFEPIVEIESASVTAVRNPDRNPD